MQAAAFNRAVDLLTGVGTDSVTSKESARTNQQQTRKQDARRVPTEDNDDVAVLMERIDSTQHPGVRSSSKVLDRALMVLQIARTEHDVDGLAPNDIARILTDKFRVNTSDAAVRMALGKVTNLVNRVPRGKGFVYRIMGPGEEYLSQPQSGTAAPETPEMVRPKRTRKPRREESNDVSSIATTDVNIQPKERPRKKTGGATLGPKAAVISLVESGFFASAKTGPDVQQHLKTKRGFDLGTPQLRLAMLRLVRDGVLERSTNSEGQYEYKRPQNNS